MLTIKELKEFIVLDKPIPNFLIFTGEETYVLNEYIKKIGEKVGTLVSSDNYLSVKDDLSVVNDMLGKTLFYIYEDDIFKTNQKVLDFVKTLKHNYLIVRYNKIDKKTKFYNDNKDCIVFFNKMSDRVLYTRLSNLLPDLNNKFLYDLIDYCDGNYSRLLLEIDKIKTYCLSSNLDTNTAFTNLLKDKQLVKNTKGNVFDFINMLCSGYLRECFIWLNENNTKGENTLGLVSLLYSNLRYRLLYNSCKDKSDVMKITGLEYWQLKNVKENGNFFNVKELLHALAEVKQMEYNIKNGIVDSVNGMYILLYRVFYG